MTMREILFRGKWKGSDCWVRGDLYTYPRGVFGIKQDDCFRVIEVDPVTVGQYTGLTDKNGEKIFEGDIVRAVRPATRALKEFVWPRQVVVFRDGAFGLERFENGRKVFVPFRSYSLSVTFENLGNIHDNPEQMEGN